MLSTWMEDVRRYPGQGWARVKRMVREPGFWALTMFRAREGLEQLPRPLRLPFLAVLKPTNYVFSIVVGIELQPGAKVGPGLYIGHYGNMGIARSTVMGKHCNLSHGVTIGVGPGPDGKWGAPVIGDRVYIAPGAKIFGPIRVGNDVAIGANAVVCRDVPDGVTVGGVPAKIISNRGSRDWISVGQEKRKAKRNELAAPAPELEGQRTPTRAEPTQAPQSN